MYNLLVFGSGRSGTSSLTGALAASGYGTGDDYLEVRQANAKGFFEDSRVNKINENILKQYVWNIPEGIRRTFFPAHTFYRARWLARLKPGTVKANGADPKLGKRVAPLLEQEPYCYKDPRFSYTLPAWQPFLGERTRFLCIFRHPVKTAASILRECQESEDLAPLKMNRRIALKVWASIYANVLHNYRESPNLGRWLFLHFDQLFLPEAYARISAFIGTEFRAGTLNRKLSRTVALSEEEGLPEGILHTYDRLCDLAGHEVLEEKAFR